MYLKSIRIQGFKSFADKLDLEINKGITGIVGPNGSGKSNIVDAVRWVLGEQSIKSLRGSSSMSDVIFTGSDSREAQKRAMVALVFDNADHYLNSEFQEIEVKRVVYSTGENEYYINNSKVRLKDITDLFIESGAGSGAFNIISQGNVTDIVNSKSQDRRLIFESAAGVLKYKKRKEESLRKLEKTEENLVRIKLVIDELSKTVEPLKEQSIQAQKYLDTKNELNDLDIALMCQDIQKIDSDYKNTQNEVDDLKNKIESFEVSEDEVKLEKIKLQNLELEDTLNNKKEQLLNITKEISDLNSEKQITMERQKYEIDKETINSNLVKLKEEELELKNAVEILNKEILSIEANIADEKKKNDDNNNELLRVKVKRSNTNSKLIQDNKDIFVLQNKIDILENNIQNDASMPASVRNILNNVRLKGVHSTIGKLIEVNDDYALALDTALGFNKYFIVVDNEDVALKSIEFLKEQKLGRATFFPLNIIKGRRVDESIINNIKSNNGYLGILSDLIKYDNKYQNIIENQLGNVIVVKNATDLNTIGKLIDYKYRVVSLDGEILHVGGSITGGLSKKNNIVNEKNELIKLKEEEQKLQTEINSLTHDLEKLDKEINELEQNDIVNNKRITLLSDELFNKKNALNKKNEQFKEKTSELEGINNLLNDSLSKKVVDLLEQISKKEKEKEILEKEINKVTKEKSNITDEITELEKKYRDSNLNYNRLQNDLKEKEIQLGKMEVKLDNLLVDLSEEYNLTYEYASVTYPLEIDADIAREKVTKLKNILHKLGDVNLGSIAEYERLSTRYNFLFTQKEDLEKSSEELKSIIDQMDDIMIDKFKRSFEKISVEFTRIFRLMFKGGKGELRLTNPEDLLNTGIDIVAVPPGKKISNTFLLSGGEKALTAICLLFAMLEVKPAPFIVLDEAEAALDEVNVDMFGKYLNEQKDKSQFIIITHKKRMMEYADSLYGITMQESGVSKIVSAKLEGLK